MRWSENVALMKLRRGSERGLEGKSKEKETSWKT
jgi:hypothetical protein